LGSKIRLLISIEVCSAFNIKARTTKVHLNSPEAGPFAAWRRSMAGLFELAAQPHEIGRFEGDCSGLLTRRVALTQTTASSIRLAAKTLLRNHASARAVLMTGWFGVTPIKLFPSG
jgi:hypothetical protein